MIKGTTKSGFRFEVNENIGRDLEILRLVRKSQEDDLYIIDLAEKVLGERQLNILQNILKKRRGYADVEDFAKEIFEIFTSIPQLKN